ncbi:uncharacterized protein L203_103188 [Cryptococcus depauperatus CBS 7841]|uniref:Cysteine-rich transmembrane CYSTM domain-containing protein n=1 Tax=Cryptococcus depauperatus CBS 7841 TaxID=1295531 RepID=A0AAJ8M113_9TREE
MNNHSYPTMDQGGQQMYQASDGNWYPISTMPKGWNGQQPSQPAFGGGQYQQQPPMHYQTQPVIYEDRRGVGAGAGAGMGLCAGLCAGLLCFDLCLFC